MRSMGSPLRVFALATAVLLGSSACGSRGQAGPEVGPMAVDRELTVENNVGLDLRITILHGSVRTPLGTVRGSNSRSFRLPPGIPDLVRIMAEPQGGGFGERLVSEPVSFHGEPVVRWIIRPGGLNTVIYGGLRGRT